MRPFILLLAIAALPAPLLAATTSDTVTPSRAQTPFALDATLTDPRWATAAKATSFTDISAQRVANAETTAAFFYDEKNIYIAFWCNQTQPVTAQQRTNDIGFGTDDYAGFGIDPGGNADRVYQFEVTPAGTRYQQATESSRYRPHWQAAARVADGRWTAMMIVPLSALRFSSGNTHAWRVNFFRYVASGTQRLSWGYDGRMDTGSGFPDLLDARFWPTAAVQLTHVNPKPPPSADIYTLLSAGGNRDRFATPASASFQRNPRTTGIDVVYPLTATMSFVGTLNPDFSNVDADQLTITPQVFPRNLTEYRPFFAQGANFINNAITQISFNEGAFQTFYSPSIGTFDRGFKLEGTLGKYQSLGVLEARGSDDTSGVPFDDVAFGYKHVLPSRTFGYWSNGVVANHGAIHDNVFEFGMQARDLETGWVGALVHGRDLGTNVIDPSRGLETSGFIDRQKGNDQFLIGFRDVGPLYDPIDGYTPVSDIRGFGAKYYIFGSGSQHSLLHDGNVYLVGDRFFDESGAVHEADAGFIAIANLKNDIALQVQSIQTEARAYGGNFQTGYPFYRGGVTQRFDQNSASIGYRPNSPSPVNLQYAWGPFGDFYLQQITSTTTRQLGKRYTLSFEYDGTREHYYVGSANGQWLRKIGFGWSIDRDTTLSLALRSISGTGGFANPGVNLAGTLHRLYGSGDELFLSFGTPGANHTINRFLAKYSFKVGGSH